MTRVLGIAGDRLRGDHNRCPYCVTLHGPAVVNMGLDPQAVERVLEPTPPRLDAVDVLVRDDERLVIERSWGIRNGVFEARQRTFSDAQIVEITLRISLCNLFNQLNEATQSELDEGVLEEVLASGRARCADAAALGRSRAGGSARLVRPP